MAEGVSVECSHCKAVLKSNPDVIGRIVNCPKCKNPFMADLAGISETEIPARRQPVTKVNVESQKKSVAPAEHKDEAKPMPEWLSLVLLTNSFVTAIYFSACFAAAIFRVKLDYGSPFSYFMAWAWAFGFTASLLSIFLYRATIAKYAAIYVYLVPAVIFCIAIAMASKHLNAT